MSLFNLTDDPLAMGQDQGLALGSNYDPMTSLWNPAPITDQMPGPQAPTPPAPPNMWQPGDVSGFASYGMEAPQLSDSVGPLGKLMAFMSLRDRNKEDPFLPQQKKGGLMSYLDQLGV